MVINSAQLTRLVARWAKNRLAALPLAKRYRALAAPFVRKYSANDIEPLVEMDRANEDVCGPAIVRIDTVHQGDLDGIKGVYHITCVDCVSQWQVMACVQAISEAYLLPMLALIMEQFPFVIEGFHCDNGSEFINGKVARLLEKLRIEQTRSRPRQSNDNALAESKNASVVRQAYGLQPHPPTVRRAHQRVLRAHVQSLAQFAPFMLPTSQSAAKKLHRTQSACPSQGLHPPRQSCARSGMCSTRSRHCDSA